MTEMAPIWDTDLSPEEAQRLNPFDKGRRTLAGYTRKVEILEGYGRDGIPAGSEKSLPRNRTKLRQWKDASRQLWPWADPAVDSPKGRNAELNKRFEAALETIDLRLGKRQLRAKEELDIKDRTIAALERQNAILIDENKRLKRLVGLQPISRR